MRLSKLLENLGSFERVYTGESWECEIFSLSFDSREVGEGCLFFCLTGGETDGHIYAEEAIEKGASAIVVEKILPVNVPQICVQDTRETLGLISAAFYGNPSEKLKVIGITGTNGKTTTTYMLSSIFEKAGKKTGVIGTLGAAYEGKIRRMGLTTPDPILLQKTLADMFLRGVEYVIIEVSAHALFYKKTAGVRFIACIFTNLTQDHLDFFPSMREYQNAKNKLFERDCPLAILNGDEETGLLFGKSRTDNGEGKTVYYGLNAPTDAFAIVTDETIEKSECLFNITDKLCRVSLSMTGRHNVYNALAAATCAVELGIDVADVSSGLAAIKGVNGRLERVKRFRGADVFVDFAHTPDGLEKSLSALRPHCKGRLVCLFGCGGNRDKSKRAIMGETAAKKADFSLLTSDNPRYEDPLDIITEIERGYRRFSLKYVVVPDREKALDYALDFIKEGDVLLVAGKGGETYQEIMGIKYAFNDNDIIEKIIKKKESCVNK